MWNQRWQTRGEWQVRPTQRYIGSWLLVVLCWCGACTSLREYVETEATAQDTHLQGGPHGPRAAYQNRLLPHEADHHFDKTEVDLEFGRLEPALRYRRPRGAQGYVYDATEADLAMPLPTLSAPSASHPDDGTAPAAPPQTQPR